jgi:hypothetical protein
MAQSNWETKEEAMATQLILPDQRHHPREDIMGQLEDITYATLRTYRVSSEPDIDQLDFSSQSAERIQ